ncbi:MAG: cell wall-binding repeat-containing protein, partial [Clostridiales bacterium]|nr:cell wall-binding repeat-containing protein [Clostridiales bacterium]
MNKKLVAGLLASSIIIGLLPHTNFRAAEIVSGKSLRYYGVDRYKTSAAISRNGFNRSEYVVIASGEDYPDALCAAPLAKKYNAPILLVNKNSVPSEIKEEIKRLNAKKAYIVGGDKVVSLNVESELKGLNLEVTRVWGQDRYSTSYEVAKLIEGENAVIASGEDFPDALSIAPIAAKMGWPILLTQKNSLPIKIKQYLDKNKKSKVYIIGGPNAISDNVKLKINNSERISGTDRFKTNLEIAKYFSNILDFNKIYIAIGQGKIGKEFADALSASPLAATTGSYVFLASNTIDEDIVKFIQEKGEIDSITIALGGTDAVPEDVLQKATIKYTDVKTDDKLNNCTYNVKVSGENVVLKDTIANKNLYIEANKVTLKNIEVKGTLFVNPGKNGVSTLDTVKAAKIVILSGGENSIYLKNVSSSKMEVNASENLRVVVSDKTNIEQTVVFTNLKLEVQEGTLGKVLVKSPKIELKGKFEKPVEILESGEVIANEAIGIDLIIKTDKKVEIKGKVENLKLESKADVKISGEVKNLEVSQEAKLELVDAKVSKISSDKNIEVVVDKNSKVEKIDGNGKMDIKGDGAANVNTGNTSGGGTSSGGSTGGTSGGSTSSGSNQNQEEYKVVASAQSQDKSLKVTVYKNGSKYKITITTNKEQTITMRVLDSEGNLKYIDQIDKLNG